MSSRKEIAKVMIQPAMIRRSVVLPLPEGPRSAVKLPSTISTSVGASAWTAPKRFDTPLTRITVHDCKRCVNPGC